VNQKKSQVVYDDEDEEHLSLAQLAPFLPKGYAFVKPDERRR